MASIRGCSAGSSASVCAEQRSLASYWVRRDGDTAFLYLLSARHARLTRQLLQQDQERALLTPATPPLETPSNGPTSQDWRGYSTLPPRLSHSSMGDTVKHSHKCTHIHTIDRRTHCVGFLLTELCSDRFKWSGAKWSRGREAENQ